jgi:AbrB family looped-hinge helix DNA binding protein
METGIVTIKGQVVIPSKMRRRLGIGKGARVCFIERDDDIVIRPLTKDYFEKMAGVLRTRGKLSKSLLTARQEDRIREKSR